MDQIKTGQFIAECRKKKGLTQMQLAEKLNITDRAISKWERGKSLPDSAIMLPLCAILGISVNELLIGEYVMEKNNEKAEQLLLEMVKQKEQADKRLLAIEVFVGVISISVFFCVGNFCVLRRNEGMAAGGADTYWFGSAGGCHTVYVEN